MKRKIGRLNINGKSKQVVQGDGNLLTENEILLSTKQTEEGKECIKLGT